jgi:hypothetical protein
MTISTETLNQFWKTNLETGQQFAQLAMGGAVKVFGSQVQYLADISQLSRDKQQAILSDHSSMSVDHWLQFLGSHLDAAADMTLACLDATMQFQFAASRFVKDQIS